MFRLKYLVTLANLRESLSLSGGQEKSRQVCAGQLFVTLWRVKNESEFTRVHLSSKLQYNYFNESFFRNN